VADGVVEGACGEFAAVDVGDGDAGDEGGLGGGEDFVAVAEEDEDVGSQPGEGVGKADDAEADRFGDAGGGVAGEEHFDFGVDGEAVGFDVAVGQPEVWRQVGAGGDDLEGEVRVAANFPHEPGEQAVFGPRPGDDADFPFVSHEHHPIVGVCRQA